MSLEIRAQDTDVRKYLDGRMSHPGSQCLKDRWEEVREKIVDVVDGMHVWFLLAVLYFELVNSKKTPRKIKNTLDSLRLGPEAYSFAYDNAMERIQNQDEDSRELTSKVLSWVIYAQKPLHIYILRFFLAMGPGDSKFDKENVPSASDVVSVCAGLVTTDHESRVVRLVHYTTEAYFAKTGSMWFPVANDYITAVCTTYLSFKCLCDP
ncbi:hypothetical protein F4810DRAFT_707023 [Camillea tinctor]|nr:hypothetical protein F4810DRAFT_707023 [Camillea tinctor]